MRFRFVLSSAVAIAGLLAVGAAVLAAGGGGFGQPGTSKFSDVTASAELNDSSGTFLFLNVDRGVQTFKLRGVSGPPVMTGPETVLNYFSNGPTGSSSGCFVIPDSSFNVAAGLSTATLVVDPSIETPCPGVLLPADAGGRPGLAGPAPEAGGGGGGFGQPITANLTWTSNGAVTDFKVTTDSRCQGAVATSVGSSSSTIATVSGSVSPLLNIATQAANIDEFETTEIITQTFSNACTGA